MVALQAAVDDPEVFASRRRDRRFANCLVSTAATKAPYRCDDAQNDVHGIAIIKLRPGLVRRPRTMALGFAPGATPLAPSRLEQHELFGLRSSFSRPRRNLFVEHHNMGIVIEYCSVK
jgi:hypothetical protein